MTSRSAPRRIRTGDARDRAADVLVRVETEGAFAAPVLNAALDRPPPLSPPDRALTTELVYGVLRTAPVLDARLQRHAGRPESLATLDAYTRAVLRIAAYQILALSRIPPRAAVHAAVEAIKRDRSVGLARFANAVLRKLSSERPDPLPDDARLTLALAAVPDEIVATIARALGSQHDAQSVLRAAFARIPPIGLRTNPCRTHRETLQSRLQQELPTATIEQGRISPLALLVSGGGDPRRIPAYAEGLFAIQEEGAQAVAIATAARPGMAVLDACAGRGGKTGALAAMMQSRGTLHAIDLYPDKVARIPDEIERLGLSKPELSLVTAAVDLTRGLGALAQCIPSSGYDVVLVDAPCSGLGTIARRPDILVHRRNVGTISDDVDNPDGGHPVRTALPVLQGAILDRVAPLVRPDGILLYAVCTLSRDEGPEVIASFRHRHPEFVPADGPPELPGPLRPAEVILRPDRDGTDAFMIYRLRRRSSA